MAKSSTKGGFLKALHKAWATALPSVRPVDGSNYSGALPKSCTYYAGVAPPSGLHVYVYFQFFAKSWEVGQFQIAFVISKRLDDPEKWVPCSSAPENPALLTEGCYYLIRKYTGKQGRGKVWHLVKNKASVITAPWFASSYDDQEVVFSEAIADVTQEVTQTLRRQGIAVDANSVGSETQPR